MPIARATRRLRSACKRCNGRSKRALCSPALRQLSREAPHTFFPAQTDEAGSCYQNNANINISTDGCIECARCLEEHQCVSMPGNNAMQICRLPDFGR